MSKILKVFLITFLITIFSFNICFAIDEAQLYNSQNVTPTPTQSLSTSSQETTNDTSNYSSTSYSPTVEDTSTSTTISGVTEISNNSTITNILSIALMVVGLLLMLLGVAILIRINR